MATGEKHTFLSSFMATATSRIDRAQKLVDRAGPLESTAVATEARLIWGEATILNLPEVARLARAAESAAKRLASEGSAEALNAVATALHSIRMGVASLDASPKRGEDANAATSRCRILVVDDSPFAAKALARSFDQDGFEVRCASRLNDAVDKFASFKPAVLVTDVFMPDLDVVELCEQFRQVTRGRQTAILLVSAHQESELLESLRTTGADDFVPKSAGTAAVVRRARAMARNLAS